VSLARAADIILAKEPRLVLFDIGGTLVVEAVQGTPTSQLRAEPLPGALMLLDSLARRVRIGAVTNTAVMSEDDVRGLLEGCGIAAFLEHIVTSSDVGVAKPDPRPLAVACERFSLGADEAVFVGNHAVDRAAAHAAGMAYFDVTELFEVPS